MVKDLLEILGILILLFELYRYLRKYWLGRLLEKKKKEKRTNKPAVLRPKSERGKLPATAIFVEGVDASSLEEVFGAREITIRTWLCRSGLQGKKLHERFMAELQLVYVQLDELWANVKERSQDMWLWMASDAKTKIIPVFSWAGKQLHPHFVVDNSASEKN